MTCERLKSSAESALGLDLHPAGLEPASGGGEGLSRPLPSTPRLSLWISSRKISRVGRRPFYPFPLECRFRAINVVGLLRS